MASLVFTPGEVGGFIVFVALLIGIAYDMGGGGR